MARAAERAGRRRRPALPALSGRRRAGGLAAYRRGGLPGGRIPVIVYSRNNGVLAPDTALRLAERCPNLIALKDGTGDFEALVSLRAARRRPAGADQRRADRRDHRARNASPPACAATPRPCSLSCREFALALFRCRPRRRRGDGRPAARRVLRAADGDPQSPARLCRVDRQGRACASSAVRPVRCGRRSSTSTRDDERDLAALIEARRRAAALAGARSRRLRRLSGRRRCGSLSPISRAPQADRLRPPLARRRRSSNSPTAPPEPVEVDVLIASRFGAADAGADRAFACCRSPGAGPTRSHFAAVPPAGWVCNAYEHEGPIAEYVLSAMLDHTVGFGALTRRDPREGLGAGLFLAPAARRARRQDRRPDRPRPYRRRRRAARQGVRHEGDGGDRRGRARAQREYVDWIAHGGPARRAARRGGLRRPRLPAQRGDPRHDRRPTS